MGKMRNAVGSLLLLFVFFCVYCSCSEPINTQCATTLTGPGKFCPSNNCARRIRTPEAAESCADESCCNIDMFPTSTLFKSNSTRCPFESAAHSSIAFGPGLVGGLTHTQNTFFQIQMVDSFCNNATAGSANVIVQILYEDGTAIPANVQNNNNGTYTVTYVPSRNGTYTISAQVDYSKSACYSGLASIYGSPYSVSWIAASYCPFYDSVSRKPSTPLSRCPYTENACCQNEHVKDFGPDYAYIVEIFQSAPQCIQNFEILTCGLRCSPAQEGFLYREGAQIVKKDGLDLTATAHLSLRDVPLCPNSSNSSCPVGKRMVNEFRVCSYFAEELFNSCRGVEMNGFTFGDFNRSFTQFIQWNNPDDEWPIVVTDTDCYNGSHVASKVQDARLGGAGGISENQKTVVFAGTNNTFRVQSVDIFKNPRIRGGDGISATLVSGPPNNQLQLTLEDTNNGFYSGTFNATTVGSYVISINDGAENIQRDLFQFEVVSGENSCASSTSSTVQETSQTQSSEIANPAIKHFPHKSVKSRKMMKKTQPGQPVLTKRK